MSSVLGFLAFYARAFVGLGCGTCIFSGFVVLLAWIHCGFRGVEFKASGHWAWSSLGLLRGHSDPGSC